MSCFRIAVFSLLLVTSIASRAPAEPPSRSPADAARAEMQAAFGFVPRFLRAIPDRALAGAWRELADLQMNPRTALPGKIKELIGLAVASQIPCHYCIYAHTQFARLHGASEAETGEAVVMAALARHWSTFFNGIQTDEARFRGEIGRVLEHVRNAAGKAQPTRTGPVTDRKSALAEIQRTFGFVPEFLQKFPESGLAGAWIEMRDVEMSSDSALPEKYKSLISLAVASQIPCRFCIIADTEFATLAGANEHEIAEAIAMASLVRHWSTLLNGLQVDEIAFRKDIDRLVRNAKVAAANASRKP